LSHRVASKSTNLPKMWLGTTAAMLAICLLALVETTNTAEATSLPHNGKIAFSSYRDSNFDIYIMNADGTDLKRLTNVARGIGAHQKHSTA
jgi:hypothetical protein